jgi:hypothetical protein
MTSPMLGTYRGRPVHTINEYVIAQAVHHMAPGHVPEQFSTAGPSQMEALTFVHFLTKLALSPVTKTLAEFLGVPHSQFSDSDEGTTVIQELTDSIINTSAVSILSPWFAIPWSKPWRARAGLIRYLTAILVESQHTLESDSTNHRSFVMSVSNP